MIVFGLETLFYLLQNFQQIFIFFQKKTDITSQSSFKSIAKWIDKLNSSSPDPNCFVLLIGSKLDVVLKDGVPRAVMESEAEAERKKYGAIAYMETSAKTGENVKEVFQEIVKQYSSYGRRVTSANPGAENVAKLGETTTPKPAGGCC